MSCRRALTLEVCLHWACLSFAMLWPCGLKALNPAHGITQYAHTSWTRREGHVSGSIYAITQTRDGYLWVGTDFGLLRYDGGTLPKPWQPPAGQRTGSEYVTALAGAPDGSLWIGTRDGLSHWDGKKIENFKTSKGPSGPGVAAIRVDRKGGVWAGTTGFQSGGLCHVEGNGLKCYDTKDGIPLGIISLFEDSSGTIWAGAVDGLCRWTHGAQCFGLNNPNLVVSSIAETHQHEIVAASMRPGKLERLVQNQLSADITLPDKALRPRVIHVDRDGGLWIGTDGSGLLHQYQGRSDYYNRADGLSGDVIRGIYEDQEGNIWTATDGGMDRFRDFAVATVSKREGLAHDITGSVFATNDGGMLVGTAGGLNRLKGAEIDLIDQRDGLPFKSIMALFQEKGGRVWVSSPAGVAFSNGGRFQVANGDLGEKVKSFVAATEDNDNCVWLIELRQGLIRVCNGEVREVVSRQQLNDRQARALITDPHDGGLWIGFTQGGIAKYRAPAGIQWYGAKDKLASGVVTDLHFSRDGTLWIATQGGLSRMKSGAITTVAGLPCERIHAMVEDDDGALWLNSACGLLRITGGDLKGADPNVKDKVRIFGATEGMRVLATPSGYFRKAAKSRDGRLWFVVLDGIAVVDPKHLPENRMPPPVHIQQITADGQGVSTTENPELRPLTKEVQIEYAGLSLMAPEKVRYRYKLQNFDKQWNEVGGRRQAVYTNLPPGNYEFKVVASNNDGVWNESGASLGFLIQPAYYQTIWFRILLFVAACCAVWVGYHIRLRQVSNRLKLLFNERLDERTRVARELHDTLLQNIAGFALQLEALSKIANTSPTTLKDRLRDLRAQAEGWMHEARESVWDLRSPTLEGDDLPTALHKIGQPIFIDRSIKFDIAVIGDLRPVEPAVQENLLKIAQEALRNAVRHGNASEVQVQLNYLNTGRLLMRIRDNGGGFDVKEASNRIGHWGLSTMRERAQKIGAEFRINSAPGQGAEIEIEVPVRK